MRYRRTEAISSAISRQGARKARRGAALVEAAVVTSFLVVFWAAMAVAYTAGRAKLVAQNNSRVGLMYYVSNECKKKLPESAIQPPKAAGTLKESSDAAVDPVVDGAPLRGRMSARSDFFFAWVNADGAATLVGRTARAQSSSWAICNEGNYDGSLLGLFAYGYDMFEDILPEPVRRITP